MRALVLGHFSTVGDIESLAWVEDVLRAEGMPLDVAPYSDKFVKSLPGAVHLASIDPRMYTHLIVVCGPIWPGLLERRGVDLRDFAHCTRIGVNLTMVEPLARWNPFHVLLERDSDRTTRPDLTFARDIGSVPVAGICTIARQREYGDRQRHGDALRLIDQLVSTRELATLAVDTRWPASRNAGGLRSSAQVLAVMARLDVLLTNRLHGLVFALKAGVPVLAVDSVQGGGKVSAQSQVLGWPAMATIDGATPERLGELLDWCLSEEGRAMAGQVAARARSELRSVDQQMREALRTRHATRMLPATAAAPAPWVQRLSSVLRKAG